jgi:transcriptional regulator with XRE-family HTH domain
MKLLFGKYIRQERLNKDLTLRSFCKELDLDVSNWSKVERGLFNAPTDQETLRKISNRLQIDYGYLSDLAHVSIAQLPEYSEKEFVKKLPLFFRKKPTEEQLRKLYEFIKEKM